MKALVLASALSTSALVGCGGATPLLHPAHAFALGKRPTAWALSIGVGLDAAFEGRQGTSLPDVDDANLFGFGADVPVLLGWKSTAGLYYVWLGARFGYEHDTIQ